jgi:hypothetical protein
MQQFSDQLGTDPAQTHQAVAAALPMLLGALGHQASNPDGAQALFGSLGDHAGGLENILGSLLGGGQPGAQAGAQAGAPSAGTDILGNIFGNSQSHAANGLGEATGIGGGNAANLLQMLAPLVMAFLAQHAQSNNLDAGGLGQALGQERDAAQQSGGLGGDLLGALLGQAGGQGGGLGGLGGLLGGLLGGGRR